MKYPKSVYETFGFDIFPVKDGYRILQLQDNWIYEKVYKSKGAAYEWVDFMIEHFINES